MTIRYRIGLAAHRRHRFAVELEVPSPAPVQDLALPVWIPGSYLVREFAKHVVSIDASRAGRPVALERVDKTTWRARSEAPAGAPLVVRLEVHAHDPSVRAAFLDATRAFWNATSLCLRVVGREDDAHALALADVPAGWDVATTLPPAPGDAPHAYVAASGYDELVDHPFEAGRFWRADFDAAGTPHAFVVTGAWPDFDGERLVADTRRICEAALALWHGGSSAPPFDRYLFLLNAVEDGRGGLEHRASTALVAPRRDLPRRSRAGEAPGAAPGDGYADVLGLVAHEYFHAWNVKRLRPTEFARIDYGRENPTRLLWFFEGFTSYYDDLLVLRSGAIDRARYLKLLAKTISAVLATPGRHVSSVADASLEAWIKHYRPDENTPNATVSYYAKGSLVALALDLTLRAEGHGTLDDVLRRLWSTSAGGAISEGDIADALAAVGRRSYARELAAWVHGTGELPLEPLLARVGVAWQRQPPTVAQRLGVRVAEGALTGIKVTHVLAGGAGEAAGLSPGDELLAVDGWRLRRLDDAERVLAGGGAATLLVGREQRIVELRVDAARLAGAADGAVSLSVADVADADARRLLDGWLGSSVAPVEKPPAALPAAAARPRVAATGGTVRAA